MSAFKPTNGRAVVLQAARLLGEPYKSALIATANARLSPLDPKPSQELHSREELAPVFADLNQYAATTHFVGQSTILTLNRDRALGQAYCIAHHLTVDGEKRRLMIAYLRYVDTFTKIDGAWLFAERLLYVDWLEQRALS
jgi:hypothetical protein